MALSDTHSIFGVAAGIPPARATLPAANIEFARSKDANEALTRISVNLFSDPLKPVRSVHAKARKYLDDVGLPWGFQGQRVIDNKISPEVASRLQEFQQEALAAWNRFLTEYPAYVEAARKRNTGLGQLFEDGLFPPVSELRDKYHFDVMRDAITDPDDPRAGLSKGEADKLRKALKEQEKRNIQTANLALFDKMRKPLERIVDSMTTFDGGRDGHFTHTMITQVQEMADLIPGMNLGDNRELKRIRRNLVTEVCSFEGKDLKKDPDKRQEILDAANATLDRVGNFGMSIGAPSLERNMESAKPNRAIEKKNRGKK